MKGDRAVGGAPRTHSMSGLRCVGHLHVGRKHMPRSNHDGILFYGDLL